MEPRSATAAVGRDRLSVEAEWFAMNVLVARLSLTNEVDENKTFPAPELSVRGWDCRYGEKPSEGDGAWIVTKHTGSFHRFFP
jgi:hypothetical protein